MPSSDQLSIPPCRVGQPSAAVSIGSICATDRRATHLGVVGRLTVAGTLTAFVLVLGVWVDSSSWLSLRLAAWIGRSGLSFGQTVALCAGMLAALPVAICGLLGFTAALAIRRNPSVEKTTTVLGTVAGAIVSDLIYVY